MKNKSVAVLGAGPMGLSVAYELLKRGYSVTIYEAGPKVGGMTASFDFGGLNIERFYHFHCTSDDDFFDVLNEFELEGKLHWVKTKMGYWFNQQIQEWGNPVALLKFKGLNIFSKIRYGLHVFLSSKRESWKPLDGLEATSWIKKWVGSEAYSVLWEKLFVYKFYDFSESLSAAWIWSRIRRIGRSRYNLFNEKLGYLEGGSDTLLDAYVQNITKLGGHICTEMPVTKVREESGVVRGVEIDQEFYAHDAVISTIPLPYVHMIAPTLSVDELSKLKALNNVAVVCVIVKLKKPVSDNFWLNINDPKMDIPGLVEYSNLQPLDCSVVYVPFYMPGDHPKYSETDEIFIGKVKSYLKEINPNLSDTDFIQIHASRYRFAQPVCGPNFLDSLPDYKSSIKNFWFADTSYYYPEDRGISESIKFGKKIVSEFKVCE